MPPTLRADRRTGQGARRERQARAKRATSTGHTLLRQQSPAAPTAGSSFSSHDNGPASALRRAGGGGDDVRSRSPGTGARRSRTGEGFGELGTGFIPGRSENRPSSPEYDQLQKI